MTTMGASTDAQRLIAVSLGKIAMSRQQRGGINLHKNLLVASVLHKARTTYMMDSFQTLLANKRAQAEKEAAAKMIVETPVESSNTNGQVESMEQGIEARGVTDCRTDNNVEVPSGERTESNKTMQSSEDKENTVPSRVACDQNTETDRLELKNDNVSVSKSCDRVTVNQDITVAPIVTGKLPLSLHNGGGDYVRQLPSCRCAGNKRRRSFVDCEQMTQPKKPRYESEDEDSENSDYYDSESEFDSRSSCDESEVMNTEPSQVTSLVDIFNSGFKGLNCDNDSKTENSTTSAGHINVYVSAERHNQYVLTDISCATAVKDNVTIPTAIALAV